MEKFIVSARKYRPQLFNTVVGQSHITTTLKNAIRNQQLAHAFLFCGPRGVGKTTCARILAKTINCENPDAQGEACNQCNSCVSFNDGASLNIHELDAASNNSVDDIRTLVEQVRFAPQAGKYKVYIIDEVHMLSSSAFNAFLKTLEEPPPYAIFILATTEKHKILPTILSRCQIFDFKRITTQDTADHLQEICEKEGVNAEMAALQLIAQKSEGCMRDALSIMDKIVSFTNGELNYPNTLEHLNILDADYYFKVLEAMLAQDVAAALLLYDEINRKGFEGDIVLNGLSEFIRNLLVCRDPKVAQLLDVVERFKERYLEYSKKTTPSMLVSALNVLSEAEIQYRSTRNKRLHVELTLIKLCYLQQAIELTNSSEGLAKKKITDRPLAFRIQRLVPEPTISKKQNEQNSPSRLPSTEEKQNEQAKPISSSTVSNEVSSAPSSSTRSNDSSSDNASNNSSSNSLSNSSSNSSNSGSDSASNNNFGGGSKVEEKKKLGSLDAIRNRSKYAMSQQDQKVELLPLEQYLLQEHWQSFADLLRSRKNPAVQSFELSELRIVNPNYFEVITGNNLQQKFIEAERMELAEFLQQKFGNPRLLFQVLVEERPELALQFERPASPKELFQKMAEQYPLVLALKQRLRLEIDG